MSMSSNLDAEIARRIAAKSKCAVPLPPTKEALSPEDQAIVDETAAMEFEHWDLATEEGKFLTEIWSPDAVNNNANMVRFSLLLLRLNKQELVKSTRELREGSLKDGEEEEPIALTGKLERTRRYFEGGIGLIDQVPK
jgi:hypothetical protein